MICNVRRYHTGVTQGRITGPASDTYIFVLDAESHGWLYGGKIVGDTFIPAEATGYDFIPQEFWLALDIAYVNPNGFYEFPDPLHDDLEVAGS